MTSAVRPPSTPETTGGGSGPHKSAPPPRLASSPEIQIVEIPLEQQRAISELYAKLNRIDHYRLLGVSATDDAKAIKRAYFALAKEYHPDRWFRKQVGAFRPKIEAIFAALTNAEVTLTKAESRAEYDAYLRNVLKTRIAQRQANTLEADKDFAAAADVWARVVEHLPTDAYVQHRYAQALLRAGTSYDVAIGAATRAIELDPTRAEYRITAASLHLAHKHDRNALAELAAACEMEPDRGDIAGLHAALAARIAGLTNAGSSG